MNWNSAKPFLIVLPFLVAACDPSTPAAKSVEQPTPAYASAQAEAQSQDADPTETCEAVLTRMRECTDVFIPALVATRVELDKPPGIAAEDAENGRDALVAQAMGEWEVDSQPERISQQCAAIAGMNSPAMQDMVNEGARCLGETTCDGAVDCVLPLMVASWQ